MHIWQRSRVTVEMPHLVHVWALLHVAWTNGDQAMYAPCGKLVERITAGEYFYHENDTYKLRLSTRVELKLNMHQSACFQVDIEPTSNQSSKITALFYVLSYQGFVEHYNVEQSYQFGIPEFQSSCKCDCPGADTICEQAIDRSACGSAEICIREHHPYVHSKGCQNTNSPASFCCEVSVRPFEGRRFTAVQFGQPVPELKLSLVIHAMFQGEWIIFREYQRSIAAYKENVLHLNGNENVADMLVFVRATAATVQLASSKYYAYEENVDPFDLLDMVALNSMHTFDRDKYGWLRFADAHWYVEEPLVTLHGVHKPRVLNCKEQAYEDRYAVSAAVKVIRNSTGAINARPQLGDSVLRRFGDSFQMIRLGAKTGSQFVTVEHRSTSAPSVQLDLRLNQRLTIRPHVSAGTLGNFSASICHDSRLNPYLNLSVTNAQGLLLIELYRTQEVASLELLLSLFVPYPFVGHFVAPAMPLPRFITSTRFLCLSPEHQPHMKLCRWTTFEQQPAKVFTLRNAFIETAGNCPGCNVLEETNTVWASLNPRRWLQWISAFSPELAVGVEVCCYILLFLIIVTILRRCVYPLLRCIATRSRNKTAP